MVTQKQIEANRRNAQKSTGPKSSEGKLASSLNALKHGLTAETLVLPHEDAEAFSGRLDAWTRDLAPRNEVEENLTRRAATLSWKLDRADLHETAHLSRKIHDQAAIDREKHREGVREALVALLPIPSEFSKNGFTAETPTSLLGIVETTAEGCGYLLGCWNRIGDAIDGHRPWTHAEEMGIIRLSGLSHGTGAITDARILDLLIASRTLKDSPSQIDADFWDPGTFGFVADRASLKDALARGPRTVEEAAALLRAAMAKAIARLEVIRQIRETEGDAWGEAESARVASFDASQEGERLRRYQSTTQRDMVRTLEALLKLRNHAVRMEKLDAKQDQRNEANGEVEPLPSAECGVRTDRLTNTGQSRDTAPSVGQKPASRNKPIFTPEFETQEWMEPLMYEDEEENELLMPLLAAS